MFYALPTNAYKVNTQAMQFNNDEKTQKTKLPQMPVSFGSIKLEDDVMRKIGLGNHYNWYNGSGSCRYIRKSAAEELPKVIQELADAGEKIIPPDERLTSLIKEVANKDDTSDYNLTETWQAASDAIRTHIDAYNKPEEEKEKCIVESANYIKERYLSPKKNSYDDRPYIYSTDLQDLIFKPETRKEKLLKKIKKAGNALRGNKN